MQTSVPELTDLSSEPKSILDLYGPDVQKPGSYAANCLLARRLAERGVRFIQLYHMGWDQHGDLPSADPQPVPRHRPALRRPDQRPQAARACSTTPWSSGAASSAGRSIRRASSPPTNYGRDHHPRCFTIWLAGGGIKPGMTHGETDDFSYNIVRDPVEVYDLNATILHLLGIDHTRLTYKFQGRDFRLTDVHGKVIKPDSHLSRDPASVD